jgi:uncharacterized RmlC-like cupin family protein
MRPILRRDVGRNELVGRVIQQAVGKDAPLASAKMTVGFANYSAASGRMEPHNHAEEVIYVIDARDASVSWGAGPDQLTEVIELEPGMILHIPELEWHVFRTVDSGFADCLFIYGQVDNIRPEPTSGS